MRLTVFITLATAIACNSDPRAESPHLALGGEAGATADPEIPDAETSNGEIPDANARTDQDASTLPEANKGSSMFLDGFFPIAADYQPHTAFSKWKKRGVNSMIRVPPKDDVEAWTKTANQLGLRMIRRPRSNPKADASEKNLLAWHFEDEPELHGTPASELASFRKKMHAIDPKRPIHVNFWGGGILQNPDGCYGSHCYEDYIAHADFISDDIYPCNKYACDITLVGKIVKKLLQWSDGEQSVFAYIETSDWDGNGSGPSPRRFRAEVWDAVIHGARGVFYFCVRLKSGCTPGDGCLADYDATPNDIAETMPELHARLTKLGPILQRAINPEGASIKVPNPLEVGWRRGPDGTRYFLVLNTSKDTLSKQKLVLEGAPDAKSVSVIDESRTLDVSGTGAIVDDFDAYGLHIYAL